MLMMVFLCAVRYKVDRVVNGRGKGSTLEKLYETGKDILMSMR